jgi:hypothetical protein
VATAFGWVFFLSFSFGLVRPERRYLAAMERVDHECGRGSYSVAESPVLLRLLGYGAEERIDPGHSRLVLPSDKRPDSVDVSALAPQAPYCPVASSFSKFVINP